MPTKKFAVSVSGKVYENGVQKRFKVKPSGTRKRGYGYQVKYELDKDQLRQLVDIMLDIQAPEQGDAPLDVVDAVSTDLGRFPAEAGLR